MRHIRVALKVLVLVGAITALYFGVVQGEWSETMFNATLL